MKKLVEQVEDEGLEGLLGETVTLYCDTYIYTGKLAGVNEFCVLLQDAKIVYNTGSHKSGEWGDAEPMPNDWYVCCSKIESFGIFK